MRMKYYLRGLGVGIITATLILSVFMQKEDKLSDEEVMARARELGMVMAEEGERAQAEEDSGVLRAVVPKAVLEIPETGAEEKTDVPEKEGAWEDAAETVTSDEEIREQETQTEDAPEEDTANAVSEGLPDSVKITISEGDSSYTVADKLETAGLIEKATEFDHYLIDSGYEKYIRTGEFLIPRGAGNSEIVKIIAGR